MPAGRGGRQRVVRNAALFGHAGVEHLHRVARPSALRRPAASYSGTGDEDKQERRDAGAPGHLVVGRAKPADFGMNATPSWTGARDAATRYL